MIWSLKSCRWTRFLARRAGTHGWMSVRMRVVSTTKGSTTDSLPAGPAPIMQYCRTVELATNSRIAKNRTQQPKAYPAILAASVVFRVYRKCMTYSKNVIDNYC